MKKNVRIESDLLGKKQISADALYGIHTQRAVENFPLAKRPVHPRLIHAYGQVKLACAQTNHELQPWSAKIFDAIAAACVELTEGKLDAHIVVDALQGGAGTSTNMNVNEVLANRALQRLKKPLGDYKTISPLDDINRHQSTNDTYPTALKIAAIVAIQTLEQSVVALQEAFQQKEREFAGVVKIARTQLQDAVLTTLGRQMSAYAEPLSRDRWRIYKCEERLRVINLGGTAIGTGLGAPRQYIFSVSEKLREITGLGLARAENLVDATQNADVFVEVSGMLRALASTLLKISNDLRLLSSGPDAGIGEIQLPALQAGSSIMPGKVNPVIPEAVAQAAMTVFAYDQSILLAASSGNLELNPFLPLVADALLNSVDLLSRACDLLRTKCVEGIRANRARCQKHLETSTATLTALMPRLGYEKMQQLARDAQKTGANIKQLILQKGLLTEKEFHRLTSPEAVTRLGN